MTDQELADALSQAEVHERLAREHLRRSIDAGKIEERNAALEAVRQTTASVRAFEKWIALRAKRKHAVAV